MTAAAAILAACAERDIVLFLDAGRLRYSAPPGVLTDADRETIAEHRPALVALLASAEPGPGPTAAPVAEPAAPPEPVGHCPACGSPSWWRSPSLPGWRCAWCAPRGNVEDFESVTLAGGQWAPGTAPPAGIPTTAADVLALHGPLLVAGAGTVRTADVLAEADPDDLPELRDRAALEGFAAALLADRRLRPLPPRALDPAAPREPPRQADRVQAEGGAWRTPDQHDAIRAFDRHFWRCTICMRAGRGYGSRCPTGAALHTLTRGTKK